MRLNHYNDITKNVNGIPSYVYTGFRLNYSKIDSLKSTFQVILTLLVIHTKFGTCL